MSHYHMVGGMITAYHSNDKSCGGGSHTRHDAGIDRYRFEMAELQWLVHYPWLARRLHPRQRSAFRNRRHGR